MAVTPDGKAVRAAGVRGDVAADRAGLLRRRVGRVVQPEVGDGPGEIEVQHAGLHPRHPFLGVDLEDPIQLGGDDHERVVDRRRPAGEAGTAPPRDERPVVPCRDAHCVGDLATVAREADARRAPAGDAGIAGVQRELELLRARDPRPGPARGLRPADQRAMTRDYGCRMGDAFDEAIDTVEDWPHGKKGNLAFEQGTMCMAGATREWVTFGDPEEEGRRWQIDVTFLLSPWRCIFGEGCQGVLTERAPELVHGCCSYGAHFTDKARTATSW